MTRTGLGERDIIRRLAYQFAQSRRELPLGFDEDVSAYPMSARRWLVLKTDTLVGSTDIPPGMSLQQACRKAVVATVSDFAAKGVQPIGLLISLGLNPPVRPETVNEIARGIYEACREYHCRVVGGDTGESKDLIVDCIGFGFSQPQMILRRDGATPGDIIAVTGDFGKTTAGLRILTSKSKALVQRFPRLAQSVMHPVARLETGLVLAKTGMVNSSIDSSDGLAWSLHEIARLSRVDMVLEKIPMDREARTYAEQYRLEPEQLALYGGEEYELVLTVQKKNFATLKRRVPSLIRIGTVEAGKGKVMMHSDGRAAEIEARGWEHMISSRRNS